LDNSHFAWATGVGTDIAGGFIGGMGLKIYEGSLKGDGVDRDLIISNDGVKFSSF